MKKILLIGDSIRAGYDKYIKACFSSVAEVYYPEENCRFAETVLRFLHEWARNTGVPDGEWDVIHWNAGLWDTLRLFGDGPMTPIDWYASYIERIQKRIDRLFPNAVSVFATSTPVRPPEAWSDPGSFFRDNADIRAYNAAACRVLAPCGTVIDDLYAAMESAPDEYHSDMTHFYTPEGTERIGQAVKGSLLSALGLKEEDLIAATGDFRPDKIIGI